jgi:tetrahydromethanopterin S-methyltransferase subunit B
MLSNDFWYGFALGFGLVTLAALLTLLIARLRAKNERNS